MLNQNKTVRHLFMPGHTVVAVIRLHNKQNVSEEELKMLLEKYLELNGDKVLSAGQSALIPVLDRCS